ncbi:MAG: UDP-N-acetylglucosamine--N-acetylmuramyl-(pentapeptide) pyrophosphoryl-undecaprenol N-acetylglucosamine transferase [bacterium]|nr:UDP-N-acetylglucosamine--N-acetylmuramyl-(pentapeptide) pyrophosphoryl-undecaprenol N-acetylglucosamine transferase [bacterium]
MRILFAGGGTGGHFYPIIAVAEAVNDIVKREHLEDITLYYMSDGPYDQELLTKTRLAYIRVAAGKQRSYFSFRNFFDIFKTLYGCFVATVRLAILYPDIVFGKGGYASFPALFAARLLHIPVVIHESDIVPGRVNRWVGNYAAKIALSYPEAAKYFAHEDRIALTGQPIRKALLEIPEEDPIAALALEPGVPVILVIGGSLGAEKINENIVDIMPRLVERYQIIHQTGKNNFEWMKKRATEVLAETPHKERYHPTPYLESKELHLAAKAVALVISRAGSAIFEIAVWGKPSVLIPLAIAHDDHQRENAYSYARTGAATIIEEQNLKPELFFSVITSIMENAEKQSIMIAGAKSFAKTDAAEKIAQALLSIASKHD